jgi:hypothetical protein
MTETISVPFRVEARIQLPPVSAGKDYGVLSDSQITYHPEHDEGGWIARLRRDHASDSSQPASELSVISCFVANYKKFLEFIVGETGDFDFLKAQFLAKGHIMTLPGIECALSHDELKRLLTSRIGGKPGVEITFPTHSHLVSIGMPKHAWSISDHEWDFVRDHFQKGSVPHWRLFAVLNYTGPDQGTD